MKKMKTIAAALLFTSILLQNGCIRLWQENLDIKTYMVEATREGGAVEEPLAGRLWVDRVSMLPPYNMRNLVMRENDVEFTTSYYTELLIPPAENFRNESYRWFADSGIFTAVTLSERNGATHRLTLTVTEFYADKAAMEAVLTVRAALIDEKAREVPVLFAGEYTGRNAFSEVKAEAVIRAYNEILTRILTDCEKDVVEALK